MVVKWEEVPKEVRRSFDEGAKPPALTADSYPPAADVVVLCGPDNPHRICLTVDVWAEDPHERDQTVGLAQHVIASSRVATYGSKEDGGPVGVIRIDLEPNCLDGDGQQVPFYDSGALTPKLGGSDERKRLHLEDAPDTTRQSLRTDPLSGEARRLVSLEVTESFLISLLAQRNADGEPLDSKAAPKKEEARPAPGPEVIAQWAWGYQYRFEWDAQGRSREIGSSFDWISRVEECRSVGLRFKGETAGSLWKEEEKWLPRTQARPELEAARAAAVQAQVESPLEASLSHPSASKPMAASPARAKAAAKPALPPQEPSRGPMAQRSQRLKQAALAPKAGRKPQDHSVTQQEKPWKKQGAPKT